MRRLAFVAIAVLVLGIMISAQDISAAKTKISITSQAFKNNEAIPIKYTCDGQNISPPLKFKNIPKGTKSLALIVDDPDAPKGTFNHWIVWNISPKKQQIAEGEKSKISEGINGLGQNGYFGPCPPSGIHRYNFKLYALDSEIDISEKSKKNELLTAIKNHIIQSATLTGKYSRAN